MPLSPVMSTVASLVGDAADQLDDLADRRARADDAVDRLAASATATRRRLTSLRSVAVLDRALDRDRERVQRDRLGDEVVRAGADRGDRGLEAAVAGDARSTGTSGERSRSPLAQLEAVHAAHLDVGDHDVEVVRADRVERLERGRGEGDLVAVGAREHAQQLAQLLVVIDDQDAPAHGTSSLDPTAAPAGRSLARLTVRSA